MRTSRRLVLALITSLLLSAFVAAPTRANPPSKFTFTGSGFGHGVGMSQYGARGMALESATASMILQHFYPQTALVSTDDSQTIRVNIGHKEKEASLTIKSPQGSVTIIRGRFLSDIPAPESAVVGTYIDDITIGMTSVRDSIEVTRSSKTAKYAAIDPGTEWTIRWESGTVVTLRTKARNYLLTYGQINLTWVKSEGGLGQMEITTSLRLGDQYLYGLGEVPSSWPEAALDAQVIAARTFALTKMKTIRKACDCHIYSTVRDQNFVGYGKESEPFYGIRWKSAVDRTKGLALFFGGVPAQTFFFSSSGGITQNVRDVWGSNIAYLINRPDSWSVNTKINPTYARWTRVVTQDAMAKAFGLKDVARYQILQRSAAGAVLRIRAISSDDREAILSGELFRSRLALPSTWINIDLAPELPPTPPEEVCLDFFRPVTVGIQNCEVKPL